MCVPVRALLVLPHAVQLDPLFLRAGAANDLHGPVNARQHLLGQPDLAEGPLADLLDELVVGNLRWFVARCPGHRSAPEM